MMFWTMMMMVMMMMMTMKSKAASLSKSDYHDSVEDMIAQVRYKCRTKVGGSSARGFEPNEDDLYEKERSVSEHNVGMFLL